MTKREQETVVIFNAEDEVATVETFFGPTMTQMRRLGVAPSFVHYEKPDGRITCLREEEPAPAGSRIVGARYELPKTWWSGFRRPRQLSDEQKARAAERIGRLQKGQSLAAGSVSRREPSSDATENATRPA